MKIWKFDVMKMLSVELISKFSSGRNVSVSESNFNSSLPCQFEITVAVEPCVSLGEHPTEVGLN